LLAFLFLLLDLNQTICQLADEILNTFTAGLQIYCTWK